MKRLATTAALGVLAFTPLLATAVSATAATAPADFQPISIYSLDADGDAVSTADSITGDANTPQGSIVGTVTPTEDRFGVAGGAALFDGKSYIQTKEDSNLQPLTFSAWFKATDPGLGGEYSVVDSDTSGKYGQSLIIGYDDPQSSSDRSEDGGLDVQFHNGAWDTGVKITEGVWTQAFVTFTSTEIELYTQEFGKPVVGPVTHPYTFTGPLDGASFRIGAHNSGDRQFFVGAIDDVEFYDKALTKSEIQQVSPESTTPPPTASASPSPAASSDVDLANLQQTSYGDVHIRTPDGLKYDFQVSGEYVLTRSLPDVLVQARQEPWDQNPKVTVNTGSAMTVGADKLEFIAAQPGKYRLNGTLQDLPTDTVDLPDGGQILLNTTNDFTILWPDRNTGARVIFAGPYLNIGVARLDGDLTYEGVLGNLNNDPSDDMRIDGGDLITVPATDEQLRTFAASWLVKASDSLYADPVAPSEGTNPAPAETVTPTPQTTIGDFDPAAVTDAQQACKDGGVTEATTLDACVYDVAATGDDSFVAGALSVQKSVEALPASKRTPVTALQSAATSGSAAAAGLFSNPLVLVGIGVVVLLIIIIVILLARRGRSSKTT